MWENKAQRTSGGRSRCSHNITAALGFQSILSKEIHTSFRVPESSPASGSAASWKTEMMISIRAKSTEVAQSPEPPRAGAEAGFCLPGLFGARHSYAPRSLGVPSINAGSNITCMTHILSTTLAAPLFPKQEAESGWGEKGGNTKGSGWMGRFCVR